MAIEQDSAVERESAGRGTAFDQGAAVEQKHEKAAMREVVERLTAVFGRTHTADQVGEAVEAHYRRYDNSKIRTYIPLLVEHGVRDQLRTAPE